MEATIEAPVETTDASEITSTSSQISEERTQEMLQQHKEECNDGDEKLRKWLVKNVFAGNPMAIFFSYVRIIPRNMPAPACVCATERGIKLFYNPRSFAEMDELQIEFVLSHELMHVTNRHFIRGDQMMEKYGIDKKVFYKKYAPYADLPINESLRSVYCRENHPGMTDFYKNCLTYESSKVPAHCRTFEEVVKWLIDNPQPDLPDNEQLTLMMDPNGGLYDVDGNPVDPNDVPEGATVYVIPIQPNNPHEAERVCNGQIQRAMEKSRGNGSPMYAEMDRFVASMSKGVDSVFRHIERLLKEYGKQFKKKERSILRLNRRTQLPPGKKAQKGFRITVIVDESSSMSDEEVYFAIDLVTKASLSDSMDRISIIRWTTQPNPDVDVIKTRQTKWTKTRKTHGGTDFSDIYTHELSRQYPADIHVVITDGECGWPTTPAPNPEIWLITTERGYSDWKSEYNKGFGFYVDIKSELERSS